jgi:hypothetical protein
MNHVFKIERSILVPDGTIVYPFLNPSDSTSGLPWELMQGFSLAAGDLPAHSKSKIQVLPLAAQVTFVLRGALELWIKESGNAEPCSLPLLAEQAAFKHPGTFFQLSNVTDELCRVLYIVSPPYVFDKSGDQILYDDAVVLDEDWSDLAAQNWQPQGLLSSRVTPDARQAALDRISKRDQRLG